MDEVGSRAVESSFSVPGYGFAVARFLVWCGLGAVTVVLFAGLWLPWQAGLSAWALLGVGGVAGVSGPAWWVIVLVPVVVAACVVGLVSSRRPARLPLVLVTLVGTVCVVGVEQHAAGDRWIGWGTGAALIGYPVALLLSLVLFALSGRSRLVPGVRPGPVVAVLGLVPVLVAAGLVGAGGRWYAQREVDSTTAGTAVPAVAGSPGRVMWRASRHDVILGPIALASGLVVTAGPVPGEVAVADAATGSPRWHFTREDASVVSMAASRDERTVVAVFEARARNTVLGFDAATGVLRWQWWAPVDASQVVALSDVVVAVQPDDHGTAVALDPSTGRRLWSLRGLWSPDQDGSCGVPRARAGQPGVAADADLTVVLVACDLRGLVVRAVDRSGQVRWTAHYRRDFGSTGPSELLAVSGAAVLMGNVGPDRIIALGPATGRVNWTVDSDLEDWMAVDDDTVLLADQRVPDRGRLRQVDAATGKPTAIQPPADLTVPVDFDVSAGVRHTPDGGTVHLGVAVRDGRAYVLSTRPTGDVLTVLDLRSDRVLRSYPVPGADYADLIPAPGYLVFIPVNREIALRLPAG